jgi:K+/H+ antiporter YhaU regulatory subunit KhtT
VHKLQLAVNAFMWKTPNVSKIIADATKFSAKLRTPLVRLRMQVENVNNAIMNQVTRWNSSYLMLERLLTLKNFCMSVESEKGFEEISLTSSKWAQIEKIVTVLEPVAKLTTQLQSQDLLVPDFAYFWFAMKRKLEENPLNETKLLLRHIQEREKIIFQNPIVLAGWFLDKNLNVLMNDDQKFEAKKMIRQIMHKFNKLNSTYVQDDENDACEDEMSLSEEESFEKYLRNQGKQHKSQDSADSSKPTSTNLEAELLAFAGLAIPRKRPNQIDWWTFQNSSFPILSKIALTVITAPLTEVSVERLFSHLKIILNKYRSRLNGSLIEDILFLRLNEKIF